jgi:hypothetical protein
MKANIKASLIILVILLLGIAIGFEISEISIRKKFDKLDSFREPQGFKKVFSDVIKPDEKQKPFVDSVLLAYHNKLEAKRVSSMQEVSQIMDSMKTELGKVLDEKQKAALNDDLNRMKKEPPPPPPPDKRHHGHD